LGAVEAAGAAGAASGAGVAAGAGVFFATAPLLVSKRRFVPAA